MSVKQREGRGIKQKLGKGIRLIECRPLQGYQALIYAWQEYQTEKLIVDRGIKQRKGRGVRQTKCRGTKQTIRGP